MNNELDARLDARLAGANPVRVGELGDSGTTRAATALLSRVLAEPRAAAPRRRRGLVVCGVVATAAVAAAAVVVVDARPAPPRTVVSVAVPNATLMAAARYAVHGAPATGRYFHALGTMQELVHRDHHGNRYTLRISLPTETLIPRDPHDGYASSSIDEGGARLEPVTAADAAAYRRDGSPKPNENQDAGVSVPDPPDGPELAGDRIYEGDATRLPTDPAALKAAMLTWIRAHGGAPSDPAAWLFREGAKLLQPQGIIVPPPIRVALYRMLAGLPGVRALGTVRDAAGRTAVGVAMLDRSARLGIVDWQLLISPTRDFVMATQAVVRRHGHQDSYAPAGTVLYSDLTRTARWTDALPR